MTDHCPTCGAAVRIEASGVTHYMVPVDAERVSELEAALRIIAGQEQCLDNLMSNVEIAIKALEPPR